jgi:6-oxo-cyclohex-1-ene-carbonyl-CoA hydrolase
MALDWLIRDDEIKNHQIFGDEHFGTEAPCTVYEKRPLINPKTGEAVDGLYTAWITLNNPAQLNSYTTEMVKGVTAGMHKASMERDVQVIVFTAAGDRAFCTGGNTKEYAEYYSKRPLEYTQYMDLFSGMVDGLLKARKPVICRCNGMRIAGGQEIGQACDFTVAADTASFGQAGTRHGSSPTGGSTDFLPWNLSMEQAMWQATANELWSAAKMERMGLITKAIPIKKNDKGEWVRDPRVITDKYVGNGDIVYGEFKTGDAFNAAKQELKTLKTDWGQFDAFINKMVWTLTNTTFLCLMNTIEAIRVKKKFFWDQLKGSQIYWLGANMNAEGFIGFNAFNTQKITGQRTIDFIKYRQLLAQGKTFDDDLAEAVMGKPLGEGGQ